MREKVQEKPDSEQAQSKSKKLKNLVQKENITVKENT